MPDAVASCGGSEPDCVGAFVRDQRNRVFAQRRSPDRRLLPGIWDVIGGHLEPGETAEQALARELTEETGWRLRRVEAVLADWEWELDSVVRRERDYLVEVDGDLARPRLEAGKHDAYEWIGRDNLDLMMAGRTDGDRRLRDLVAKAVRIRLTERLRLEPVGPEHAGDLWRLHEGRWAADEAAHWAARAGQAWDSDGVHKWIAYHRGTGELVGCGGLSRGEGEDGRWLELGWALRAPWWGHGYATEIGRAGLAFAFDELDAGEVVAFTERHHHRSRAVMERLSMRYAREITRWDAPFALYTIRNRPDIRR